MPQKPTDDKLGWGQMLICINYTDFLISNFIWSVSLSYLKNIFQIEFLNYHDFTQIALKGLITSVCWVLAVHLSILSQMLSYFYHTINRLHNRLYALSILVDNSDRLCDYKVTNIVTN